MGSKLLFVAFLSVVLLGPSLAAADHTIITTLDVPGAVATTAYAINDRGQIVGTFGDSNGGVHGFRRSNGQFTPIDVPGATSTSVRGINNTGQMAGYYTDNVGHTHGFVLAGSTFTTVDAPNSSETFVFGIDDLGQTVGEFVESVGTLRSFLRTHGQLVTLLPTAPQLFQPTAINGLGQIVGTIDTIAFRLQPRGDVATFAVPGAIFTSPSGINDFGEVVGGDIQADLTSQGFLLAYGTYTLIEVPGSINTRPRGINNRHQIVGAYSPQSIESNTFLHGFVMTPSGESEDLSGSASPDGSKVPQAPVVFDNDLTPWSLGPGQEVLHNDAQADGGYGSQILWYHGSIYVLGDDGNWWRWTGSTWAFAGPNDPSL